MPEREKEVALTVQLCMQVFFLLAFVVNAIGGDTPRAMGWGALGYLSEIAFELRRKRQGF